MCIVFALYFSVCICDIDADILRCNMITELVAFEFKLCAIYFRYENGLKNWPWKLIWNWFSLTNTSRSFILCMSSYFYHMDCVYFVSYMYILPVLFTFGFKMKNLHKTKQTNKFFYRISIIYFFSFLMHVKCFSSIVVPWLKLLSCVFLYANVVLVLIFSGAI